MSHAVIMEPAIYQALVLKHALRLYARTGMKVNTSYTPKNMLATASRITGQTFKPRQYLEAADALEAWAFEQRNVGVASNV